jgi:hypothetical protein
MVIAVVLAAVVAAGHYSEAHDDDVKSSLPGAPGAKSGGEDVAALLTNIMAGRFTAPELVPFVKGHPAADVRLSALNMLVGHDEIESVLDTALNDKSAHVGKRAREIAASLPTRNPGQARPVLKVQDGKVTIARAVWPLGPALEHVARDANVAIIGMGTTPDEAVEIELSDVPVDEALRRLLGHHDAFFFYGAEGDGNPARLRAVWVYPKGRGRGLAPVPPEAWAGTKELEVRLSDPDAVTRALAIHGLTERKGERALDDVLRALQDSDQEVRTRALYGAITAGVRLPAEVLQNLLANDLSSNVRFLALQRLQSMPGARAAAMRALKDPHPHIREKASEILAELGDPPLGERRP